ncbi:ZIP zinc/iron transport family, partial [Aureobasidium melanogenum]
LTSVTVIFLVDLIAERYVEMKYGIQHEHLSLQDAITGRTNPQLPHPEEGKFFPIGHETRSLTNDAIAVYHEKDIEQTTTTTDVIRVEEQQFRTQFGAFLILEFGVIFHSVVIGLNLGVAGKEFSTLYVVLIFHQSFEGLGIGARLSDIPFPARLRGWLPWLLCIAYGLTTPICIAIGLGLRTTYNPNSFTANIVSGILDSISAGILIYTGLVELLARDFIFDPNRTKDNKRLAFMVVSFLLGAGIMALLGNDRIRSLCTRFHRALCWNSDNLSTIIKSRCESRPQHKFLEQGQIIVWRAGCSAAFAIVIMLLLGRITSAQESISGLRYSATRLDGENGAVQSPLSAIKMLVRYSTFLRERLKPLIQAHD